MQVWAAKAEAFPNTDDTSQAQIVVVLFSQSAEKLRGFQRNRILTWGRITFLRSESAAHQHFQLF